MNGKKDILENASIEVEPVIKMDGRRKSLATMIEVPVLEESDQEEQVFNLGNAYATGRRKESVAKLWIFINRSEKFCISKIMEYVNVYFKNEALSFKVISPLIFLNETQNFAFNFRLKFKLIGGGKSGQSDAFRLALSKSLVLLFPDIRCLLRKSGFLTSDARRKEREHSGFRTSRKPQQYSRR